MRIESRLADRLSTLFARWERDHGRPLSDQAVAVALCGDGQVVSPVYLSHLRSGLRVRPAADLLTGLALFFDVPVDYLDCSDDFAGAAPLRDERLRRLFVNASRLSSESLDRIGAVAEILAQAEIR
ncbi:hypothetical protein [Nocardia sp. NBC_01388]|uniref:hypothetical protein n=1 Tax=Nocardia sp. NBC_01388 TaxID=2903596 RepID=UPI00324F6D12